MREIGINRINIGVQSFDERILNFLGRRHSVKQAISAVEASRKAGFRNIGLDLIYGVPAQNIDSWLDTLKQAVDFSPEHISCYQLTLESKTPLGIRYQVGEFSLPGEELQYEFFMKTSEFLEDAGYIHYEVSNFALGTKYTSRHNQNTGTIPLTLALVLRPTLFREIDAGGIILHLIDTLLRSARGIFRLKRQKS